MPTRPDYTESSPEEERLQHYQMHSSTCPPPIDMPSRMMITLPTAGSRLSSSTRSRDITTSNHRNDHHPPNSVDSSNDGKLDGPIRDTPSPISSTSHEDSSEADGSPSPIATTALSTLAQDNLRSSTTTTTHQTLEEYYTTILHSPFSPSRFPPNTTSCYLKPNSRFEGTQKSDRQTYDVTVEIQHVDFASSFLCGFLKIRGLTDEHPSLTTYFESEIIGPKYTFQTRHAEWGSNDKVDMNHWARFPEFRPLQKLARKDPGFRFDGRGEREDDECVFMRWKEYFLVPDHRVRTISGASFEGFYYICFNRVRGSISGIYFHAKSEKYQQLELTHVDDGGCMSAFEFR